MVFSDMKDVVFTWWWGGEENAISKQWKIRVTFIGPGVLCTSCKGRGSLNSYRPDVFTLKVKEIEKDDNCTFTPFPSSTYFLILHSSLLVKFHTLISTTTSVCNGEKDNERKKHGCKIQPKAEWWTLVV